METSTVAVEESHQRSDSSGASECSGSAVKNIDSITIDLAAMENNKPAQCQHFSIRGYVAEKRLQDWRVCWPYRQDENLRLSEEQLKLFLPPLDGPKFKWWQCPKEIGARSSSNGPEKDADQGAGTIAFDPTNSNLCPTQNGHRDVTGCEAVAFKSNISGLKNICESNHGTHDAASVVPASPKPTVSSSANISLVEKMNSTDGEQTIILKACETFKEVGKTGKTINDVHGPIIRVPSLQLERSDDASYESDELVAGTGDQDQQQDNASGFPRQKKRKVRLLSELLSATGKVENGCRNTRVASTRVLATTSSGAASLSAPIGQVAMQESVGNVLEGPKRKRNEAREGDEKTLHNSCLHNVDKIIRPSGRDANITMPIIKISDSESEEDASAGGAPKNGVKTQWKLGISNLPVKKKRTPRIPYLFQRESAVGEGSLSVKNKGLTQVESEIERPGVSDDESPHLGPDITISSHISGQRNETIDPTLPQRNGMPSKVAEKKGNLNVGNSSLLQKSAPALVSREELPCDLKGRIAHRTAMLRTKQNGTPVPQHKKLDSSRPWKSQKTCHVHGPSEAVTKNNDLRADKALEEGTSDDIPMEVVELVAKNQYDRSLNGNERNNCLYEQTSNTRNDVLMGFSEIHGKWVKMPLQEENPAVRGFPSSSARNSIDRTTENFRASIRNTVDYSTVSGSHLNLGQLDETRGFTMLNSYEQSQQNLSSGVQLLASGSMENSIVPDDHLSSPMTPNPMLSQLDVSQGSGIMPSNMEIQTPSLAPPNQGKVIRDFDLNTMDSDAANTLERENEILDCEAIKRSSAEYLFFPNHREVEQIPKAAMASQYPYSNETIPAMQLLSLMDGSPLKMTLKNFLEKPFSPCEYHPKFTKDGKQVFLHGSDFSYPHSRQLAGLAIAVNNTRSSSGNPSSFFYGQILVNVLTE